MDDGPDSAIFGRFGGLRDCAHVFSRTHPRVPLEHVRLVGARGQQLGALAVSLDQRAAEVDLEARVAAQINICLEDPSLF